MKGCDGEDILNEGLIRIPIVYEPRAAADQVRKAANLRRLGLGEKGGEAAEEKERETAKNSIRHAYAVLDAKEKLTART